MNEVQEYILKRAMQKVANGIDKEAKSLAGYAGDSLADLWNFITKSKVTDKAVEVPKKIRKNLANAVNDYRHNTKGTPIEPYKITDNGVVPNKHFNAQERALKGHVEETLIRPQQPSKSPVTYVSEYVPGREKRWEDIYNALNSRKEVNMSFDNSGITFTGKPHKVRVPNYAFDGYPTYGIGGKVFTSDEPNFRKLPFWHDSKIDKQYSWTGKDGAWSSKPTNVSKTFTWEEVNDVLRKAGIIK